jgi:hypothetical protein
VRTIWKYKLQETANIQQFDIPFPATVCHVGIDADGLLCVWVEIKDTDSVHVRQWQLRIHGTGSAIEPDDSFLASVRQGSYIWHVFIVKVIFTDKDGQKWREPRR